MKPEGPTFFIVACEPSGDLLGARLMQALRKKLQGKVNFAGVGGERMQAEGMQPLFHQSELALFGLFELVPKIPRVLYRLHQTAKAVKAMKPAALITIDGQDFSARLAKQCKGLGIPLIQYVAPTVWAWREGRAKKCAGLYDHMLTLFPFEPSYFVKEGLPTTFVGHCVLENGVEQGDAARFRTAHNIPADKQIISILPGSRRSEIKRLAPVFGAVLARLKDSLDNPVIVVPTVPQIHDYLMAFVKEWPVQPIILMDDVGKYDAFAASNIALAASGTVTLELALAGLPHVLAYKMHPFTVMIYRHLIKVKYAGLINLLFNRLVVPEFLQQNCTAEALAKSMETLWADEAARAAQKQAFLNMRGMLTAGGQLPSAVIAQTVCEVAGVAA